MDKLIYDLLNNLSERGEAGKELVEKSILGLRRIVIEQFGGVDVASELARIAKIFTTGVR